MRREVTHPSRQSAWSEGVVEGAMAAGSARGMLGPSGGAGGRATAAVARKKSMAMGMAGCVFVVAFAGVAGMGRHFHMFHMGGLGLLLFPLVGAGSLVASLPFLLYGAFAEDIGPDRVPWSAKGYFHILGRIGTLIKTNQSKVSSKTL